MHNEEPVARSAFDWIGGEPVIRSVVDRFYDLMELEPAYAELRTAARWRKPATSCFGSCVVGWAAPSTTPTALVTPGCARVTCLSRLAFWSATSGWPVWTKPWARCRLTPNCEPGSMPLSSRRQTGCATWAPSLRPYTSVRPSAVAAFSKAGTCCKACASGMRAAGACKATPVRTKRLPRCSTGTATHTKPSTNSSASTA
jgi:hypothetical protein